jgi:hypothetical protein
VQTGKDIGDDAKAKIYFDLYRGQVESAAKRWSASAGGDRALRLIAASVGAPADVVDRSLKLSADQGLDGDVYWSALGLALRHQRNLEPLLAKLNASTSDESLALRKFVTIMQTTKNVAQADKALQNEPPQRRAQAYVVGVIVLGKQAPQAWREFAKRALLVTERPYLG